MLRTIRQQNFQQLRNCSELESRVGKVECKVKELDKQRARGEEYTREAVNQIENDTNFSGNDASRKLEGDSKRRSDDLFSKCGDIVKLSAHYEQLEKVDERHMATLTTKRGLQEENIRKLELVDEKFAKNVQQIQSRIVNRQQESFDGSMTIRIDEVSKKIAAAKSGQLRPPFTLFNIFQTHMFGYSLRCKIYFNGDGIGLDKYLSVFVCICKGQFDSLLKWPFQADITLTVLDQSSRKRHRKDRYCPEPSSSSVQRPKNESNVAVGCPQFMTLEDLNSKNYGYVVEDTMFLKVEIDTTSLVHA